MIKSIKKKDKRKKIIQELNEVKYATDDYLRVLQEFNIVHWVDLGLEYQRDLFVVDGLTYTTWGSLYYIKNFYTKNNGDMDNAEWDRKYWMNEILEQDLNTRRKYCTPFILFREMNNGLYKVININKTAVEVGPNGRAYLYINDTFDNEYVNDNGCIDDTTKLKALLLPMQTDYICSDYMTSEVREEMASEFNSKYWHPCTNITITEDNKILFDSDNWYEKVKLINTKMSIFKGAIISSDRAIKVISDDISYGEKVFKESLIMISPDGLVDFSWHDDIKEMENNVYYFDTDRFDGYNYFIFYFHETNKSVNHVYHLPEKIIDHDTEEYVKDTSNYILLDKDYFLNLMTNTGLKYNDLRDRYKKVFEMEISDDNYSEYTYIYKKDEDGNIIHDEDGYPILDPNQFPDTNPVIYGAPYTVYKPWICFINYWFYRVLSYKKEFLLHFIDPVYDFFSKDNKYSCITYTAEQLQSIATDGIIKFNKPVTTLHDFDDDYDGFSNQIIFVNGKLEIDDSFIYEDDRCYYINIDNIVEKYNNTAIIEVVSVSNHAYTDLDVIISGENNNFHEFISDRYYSPYHINFFNILLPNRRDDDITPIYKINNLDYDVNPTMAHPIPFKIHEVPNTPEHYSIQFNENWATVGTLDEVGYRLSSAILNSSRENLNGETLFVCSNGKLHVYDMSKVTEILRDEYESDITLVDYLAENNVEITDSANLVPINSLYNVEEMTAFTYYNNGLYENAVAVVYGDPYNNKICISTEENGYKLILYKCLGDIVKMTPNLYTDKFAVINNNSSLFEIGYTPDGFDIIREIPVNIKEVNPIRNYTLEDFLLDRDSKIYYDDNRSIIYILSDEEGSDNSIMTEYNIVSNDEGFEITNTNTYPLDVNFVNTNIACTEDNMYILGGESHASEIDHVFYKYNFDSHTLTQLPVYDRLGVIGNTIIIVNNKLYNFGGLNLYRDWVPEVPLRRYKYLEEYSRLGGYTQDVIGTANRIGVFDLDTEEWIEDKYMDFNMVKTSVIEDQNGKILMYGGYTNEGVEATDFSLTNMTNRVLSIDPDTLEYTRIEDFPVKIAGATITRDVDEDLIYIMGNENPEDKYTIWRYGLYTNKLFKLYEMPLDYDWYHIAQFNRSSNNFASLIMTGTIHTGFNYIKVVDLAHEVMDTFFTDKYGEYNILHHGVIFTYLENEERWVPTHEVMDLVERTPISKIVLSGEIFIALSENNQLYTTPDLEHWYDYKYYTRDNSSEIVDVSAYTKFIDKTFYESFDRNIGIVTMITDDGKIILNPYCINMMAYYDNIILAASKHRFAIMTVNVDDTTDYITLTKDFKYCTDRTHYLVCLDGIRLDSDKYRIVTPDVRTPVDGIYIYKNFKIEDDLSHEMEIVYLPFPLIETNISTIYKPKVNLLEFIQGDNEDLLTPYGFSKDKEWIFINGNRIPNSFINDISNNLAEIDTQKISDTIFRDSDITTGNRIEILRSYKLDIGPHSHRTLVNDEFDDMINGMIDNAVITDESLFDSDINIEEFKEKATFEEKIVLLKIFSNHYVGNADYRGNTAPFISNFNGEYYYINNGNIVWRD